MFRRKPVLHGYHKLPDGLRHARAHPVISLHALRRPAPSVEEQDHGHVFISGFHGRLVSEIQTHRYFIFLIIYLDIQFLHKNPHGIQFFQIRDPPGGLYFNTAVGEHLKDRLHCLIHFLF